jgi:hypothetical protein
VLMLLFCGFLGINTAAASRSFIIRFLMDLSSINGLAIVSV